MNFTLVNANYDEKCGQSTVTISTPYGHFTGVVNLHPEETYPSKYFGCDLAETKALRLAEKARLRELRGQLKGLRDYYFLLADTWSFNDKDFHVKKLTSMMNDISRQIDVTKYNIRALAQSYHSKILARDKEMLKLHKGE